MEKGTFGCWFKVILTWMEVLILCFSVPHRTAWKEKKHRLLNLMYKELGALAIAKIWPVVFLCGWCTLTMGFFHFQRHYKGSHVCICYTANSTEKLGMFWRRLKHLISCNRLKY